MKTDKIILAGVALAGVALAWFWIKNRADAPLPYRQGALPNTGTATPWDWLNPSRQRYMDNGTQLSTAIRRAEEIKAYAQAVPAVVGGVKEVFASIGGIFNKPQKTTTLTGTNAVDFKTPVSPLGRVDGYFYA